MDLTAITAGAGTNLTSSKYVADFTTITGHALTRADFSAGFSWGADIDLDGFGLTDVRHFNGVVAVANFFGDGDDSAAVQAAIDFVQSASPGRGVVVLMPRAANAKWVWDATVTTHDGITIKGVGMPSIDKTVSGYMLTAAAGTTDVVIEGLHIDGNNNSGGIFSCDRMHRVKLRDCTVGFQADTEGDRSMSSALLINGSDTTVSTDITIENIFCYEQLLLASITDADGVRIQNNTCYGTQTLTATNPLIDLFGVDNAVISGNWTQGCGVTGTNGGTDGFIELATGTLNADGCRHVHISDNYVFGGSNHLCLLTAAENVFITGNVFAQAGCELTDNTWDAINVSAACTTLIITNNFCSNFPTNTHDFDNKGCRFGINVALGASDLVVTDNFLEMIDDTPAKSTHYMCGTAGIQMLATARVLRFNNRIILDQFRPDCPYVSAGAGDVFGFTCRGLRATGVSPAAERNAQIVGIQAGHSIMASNSNLRLDNWAVTSYGSTADDWVRVDDEFEMIAETSGDISASTTTYHRAWVQVIA